MDALSGAPGWCSQLSIWLMISAQVVVSQFVSSSAASGSALMSESLLGVLSLLFSDPPPLVLFLSFSKEINFKIKIKKKWRTINSSTKLYKPHKNAWPRWVKTEPRFSFCFKQLLEGTSSDQPSLWQWLLEVHNLVTPWHHAFGAGPQHRSEGWNEWPNVFARGSYLVGYSITEPLFLH